METCVHVSKSCWKLSCVFRFSVTMTIGRFGKICRSNTAKNGCADAQIPVQDSTPPFSSRRARDCAAGVSEMSANKLPVADDDSFCAKRGKVRSEKSVRQAMHVDCDRKAVNFSSHHGSQWKMFIDTAGRINWHQRKLEALLKNLQF